MDPHAQQMTNKHLIGPGLRPAGPELQARVLPPVERLAEIKFTVCVKDTIFGMHRKCAN